MRSIDFSQVLFNALQFSGNDRHNITDETFAQFRDFCNFRLKEAWEQFLWQDVCRLAPLTLQTVNDVTFFIPSSEADEILSVYPKNPQTTTRVVPVNFSLYNDNGTEKVIVDSSFDSGWYAYRLRCPELQGDVYDSTLAYFVGSQAYFDSGSNTGTLLPVEGKPHTGNFYKCIQNTIAGENPSTAAHKWQKIEIPYIFGSFLAWGSTANWFLSEGMVQEAAAVEPKAMQALELEFDKATRQQGQFDKFNMIRTY